MNIQQYKKFKFTLHDYSLLNIQFEAPISYVAIFFYDAFRYIYKSGTLEFIEQLKNNSHSGMSSEMIELNIDTVHNLAYISEPYDDSTKEITPEIEQLIDQLATIELCHKNFLGYAVMTKENLFHLFLIWKQYLDKKAPYILIYLDNNNWYDSVSFDTEESMNQFLTGHANKK